MSSIKRTAKQVFLQSMKRTGVFHAMAESGWRHERLLILCYHGISLDDEHEWWPSANMTGSLLEARLEMLHSGGYSVLPLEEALRKLYSRTLPQKSVVITFDDGMYNFYARSFPILQKYNYPATLYLTTYYSGRQLPVFPLLCSYMLWKKSGTILPSNPSLGFNSPLDLETSSGRSLAEKTMRTYVEKRSLNADQKNEFAKRLADHLGLDFDRFVSKRLCHLMNAEEVKELSKKGLDIQLHTHRHDSPLDRILFQQEIVDNRRAIKELTGIEARHHCYPSGVYRNEFLPWLSELAVASATTCDHGLADAKTNPLLLPRFLDSSNVSALEFESWLTGLAGRLRQKLRRR